jgi:hypothetical protein
MTNDTDILGAAEGSRHFDAIIVGAGQVGPSLAGRLNAVGKSSATVSVFVRNGTSCSPGISGPAPHRHRRQLLLRVPSTQRRGLS